MLVSFNYFSTGHEHQIAIPVYSEQKQLISIMGKKASCTAFTKCSWPVEK
jgi:hypothetical protein